MIGKDYQKIQVLVQASVKILPLAQRSFQALETIILLSAHFKLHQPIQWATEMVPSMERVSIPQAQDNIIQR
jgi:hypothetical protein